jgi:hypothetical protein
LQEASAGLRDCRRLERAGWVRDGSLPSPDPVDLPGINEARSLVVEQSERALSQGALLYSSPMVESGSSSHTGAGCFSAQLTPKHKTTGRFFKVTASAQVRGRFKRHPAKQQTGRVMPRERAKITQAASQRAWPGNVLVVDLATAANVPVPRDEATSLNDNAHSPESRTY